MVFNATATGLGLGHPDNRNDCSSKTVETESPREDEETCLQDMQRSSESIQILQTQTFVIRVFPKFLPLDKTADESLVIGSQRAEVKTESQSKSLNEPRGLETGGFPVELNEPCCCSLCVLTV